MLALLAVHIVAAALAPVVVARLGRKGFFLLAAAPLACAVAVAGAARSAPPGGIAKDSLDWVPALSMDIDLRLDVLSTTLALVVTIGGALVMVYCARYFDKGDKDLPRFAGSFVGFAASMLGLVLADNVLVFYVMWELTSVFSYLLIGHKALEKPNRRAALQALVVTTAGGLAMLVGLIALAQQSGSYLLSDIVTAGASGTVVTVSVGLILAGALSKSAIFPLHFWLPAAMAAPTPVSAYLHAAAMVKAGIFAVAILGPGFIEGEPLRWAVVGLGLYTMILGAWRSLKQYDLKLLLAYGTVSQLGLLTVLFGVGTRNAALAGLTLLVAHACFKASLFLIVGAVDHAMGSRDIRVLSDVGRSMPVVAVAAIVAVASMAGLPPTLGFVAKETAYASLIEDGSWLVLGIVAFGSALTLAYGARFVWGAFAVKDGVTSGHRHRTGVLGWIPAMLAAAGIGFGFGASWLDGHFGQHLQAYLVPEHVEHLALWHGFNAALGLSALSIGVGMVLFVLRDPVMRLQSRVSWPLTLSAQANYVHFMRALDRFARGTTVLTQRGSLPFYLGTVFVVLVGGSLVVFAVYGMWPSEWRAWDNPIQLAATIMAAVAALVASRTRQRVAAVLMVGVTGYACGIIFALHGAPDLALTQFLVETLTVVVFVLVLRKLPTRILERHSRRLLTLRAAIAGTTGVVMASLVAIAVSNRSAEPVSTQFPQQAYDEGGGKNVVNVTLVDIRAWDTLGEISVLLVAATGVASLVFLRKRSGRVAVPGEEAVADSERGDDWLRWARLLNPAKRSVVLEIVTRIMFHTVAVLSVFLLFAGHNAPGGGFAGGLVAGLALVVRYLAGGRYELGEAARIDSGALLGTGILLAGGVGAVALVTGGAVLESAIFEFTVPLFGELKFVTSLIFDIGVYLIVIGLVLDILRSLGAELDRRDTESAR